MLDTDIAKLISTLFFAVVLLWCAFVSAEDLDVSAYIDCSGVNGFEVQQK